MWWDFEFVLLLGIAFVANGFSALAGGGAGLLQFPILLFLGLGFATALATHKVASVALGVGASLRHMRERALSWRLALFILAWGLPGVILGALVILAVPDRPAEIALGVLTMGLGIYSAMSRNLGMQAQHKMQGRRDWVIAGLGLFTIGILNGSITSGTGLFVTMWLVLWLGLDYQRAVAYTLVLVGLVWNGMGALTLALQTEVKWAWVLPLVLGALAGGYAGAHWSVVKGNKLVKRCFELLTIGVGLSLLLKA